jgi:hypothetical protein
MALSKITNKKQIGDNTVLGNTEITVAEYNKTVDAINTNEATVAANTADVATNTSSIAANTAAVAALPKELIATFDLNGAGAPTLTVHTNTTGITIGTVSRLSQGVYGFEMVGLGAGYSDKDANAQVTAVNASTSKIQQIIYSPISTRWELNCYAEDGTTKVDDTQHVWIRIAFYNIP